MKNSLPKIQIALSVIFLLAAVGTFVFLRNITLRNNVEAEKISLENKDKDYAKEELKLLNEFVLSIGEEKAEIESHFVKSSDAVPFLDSLEGIGKTLGIKSEVTNVDIPLERDSLIVDVNVSGSFPLIYKFLKLVENSPYETEISTMSLERLGPNSSAPLWSAKFSIKVLSFIP
jgi:hypothetical protein